MAGSEALPSPNFAPPDRHGAGITPVTGAVRPYNLGIRPGQCAAPADRICRLGWLKLQPFRDRGDVQLLDHIGETEEQRGPEHPAEPGGVPKVMHALVQLVAPTLRGAPRSDRADTAAPSRAVVMAVQRLAGNRAAAAWARRSASPAAPRLVVQRHSAKELDEQIEETEEAKKLLPVQRLASGKAAGNSSGHASGHPTVSSPQLLHVQRHFGPKPRGRQFSGRDAPTEDAFNQAKTRITTDLPILLAKMANLYADKTENPAATRAALTRSICQLDDAHDVGLGPPAAASEELSSGVQGMPAMRGFRLMLRSPYFYKESGEPDVPFIHATIIHEAMHVISYRHKGLQEVTIDLPPAGGGPAKSTTIGESRSPLDSLDEAMTERLSHEIHKALQHDKPTVADRHDYETNYWQTLRDVGVHLTAEGLKTVAAQQQPRQLQEKNWTADLAQLVVDQKVLTADQLETFYLKGEAALQMQDAAALARFKQQYPAILKSWQERKESSWRSALPEGVMLASDWVALLNRELARAASQKPQGQVGMEPTQEDLELVALENVRTASNGHELVSRNDPRSHVFGATPEHQVYEDDYQILKRYFPGTTKADPEAREKTQATETWKGTDKTGFQKAKVEERLKEQSRKLGLGDNYPSLVIPGKTTKGLTFFSDTGSYRYQVYIQSPSTGVDIAGDSLSTLSHVEPNAPAQQIIANMGGGAYEMNKKVIYTNSAEDRMLLHEVGHYKQDLTQFNENTINTKLLEYHNIVLHENPHSLDVDSAKKSTPAKSAEAAPKLSPPGQLPVRAPVPVSSGQSGAPSAPPPPPMAAFQQGGAPPPPSAPPPPAMATQNGPLAPPGPSAPPVRKSPPPPSAGKGGSAVSPAPTVLDPFIRLTYSVKPLARRQSEWKDILPKPPTADPPEYVLLKKLANHKETEALTQIEQALESTKGQDGSPTYTAEMKWFLKRQLASEYFLASPFNRF